VSVALIANLSGVVRHIQDAVGQEILTVLNVKTHLWNVKVSMGVSGVAVDSRIVAISIGLIRG
tara:strand:+ start:3165 stop:3353 length:189 start_codon:yes stop_codon:yes gene_type:complete